MDISWLSFAFSIFAAIKCTQMMRKRIPTKIRRWLTGYQIAGLLFKHIIYIVYGLIVKIVRLAIGLLWLGCVWDSAAYLIEITKIWTEIQDQDIPVIFLLENATLWGTYAFTNWMVLFNSYKLSFPFLKSVKKGLRRLLRQLALPLPIFLQVFIIFRVCFSGIFIDYVMRTVLCVINGKRFWEKSPEIDEIISENVYGLGTGPLYPKTYVPLDKVWKLKI